MKLSVCIPSRDRKDNLLHVLEVLANQSLPKEAYEVIVCDDNSHDQSYQIIEAFRDRLNLKYIFTSVPKPHSWNASVIRNIAACTSDPSTIAYLFVDSDVVLPQDALTNYVADLEANSHRVIIGPYDFYYENNEGIRQPDVRNEKFATVTIDETFSTVHDGLACFGGNLVIPKDIFWSVGGFSPEIAIGLEDGDMGLKLWKVGTQFSYDARTRGKHLWHQTPEDRFPPNMKEHIDKLNLKHYGTTDPDYGLIEASRDTYASWGITGWVVPPEWLAQQTGDTE